MLKTKTISSPVGDILLYATDDALVAAFLAGQKHSIPFEAERARGAHRILDSAERDFRAYFSGNRESLVNHEARPHENRSVRTPFAAKGTAFQEKVWAALRTIPFGETWTYGQLAKEIGMPKASRAVGLANSRNPISILVPCHRVIGANGTLTGYAGGIENKKWLLDHEAGVAAFHFGSA